MKLKLKKKEVLPIPRSVQQTIPIKRIYKDGVWEVGKAYSKTWLFTDINYSVASHEDKLRMFMEYCATLNALSADAITKVNINNRRLNPAEFEDRILMKMRDDGLDNQRREANTILSDKAASCNNIVQERYVTVSVQKKNIEEARNYFQRIGNDLTANLGKLSSKTQVLGNAERLRILHDFFRAGEEQHFRHNLSETIRKGHDIRDFIAPDGIEFKSDHFEVSGRFGRVLYLKEYPSFLKDTLVAELTEFPRQSVLAIDIAPVPTDEAVKEMQKRILAVETDITRWQQKQNANNNFSVEPPYELQQMRTETKEFLDDLTARDQRMIFAVLTFVHMADSKEKLDADTETLQSIGRKHLCQFVTARYQQEDALNTVLPYGLNRMDNATRTLTTESTGVLMPFSAQEIMDKDGIYYGQNAVSRNLIICSRKNLLNSNGIICGVSGGGKSFAAKMEIEFKILNTNDDVIIVDPSREYQPVVKAAGGEVIYLSAGSANHINALDMAKDYGAGENPVVMKSEFVMSLCEQLMGTGKLGAKEKSIIDRCVATVYRDYLKSATAKPPALPDLYRELLQQKESEAREIALALELFTSGSLNVFAHQTNVNMENRVMLYDIMDLGSQLKTVGLLVMLDSLINRVSVNFKRGVRTHIYFDEMHLLFANEYSSNFMATAWRTFRKLNAECTGISQQVEDFLKSPTARAMLSNSEFLLLMSQSPTERAEIAKLLNISDAQLSYISNVKAGCGLIKVGASLVPFENDFPKDTELYRLMSTKPGETHE